MIAYDIPYVPADPNQRADGAPLLHVAELGTLGHFTRFMPTNPNEIKKREAAARAAIQKAFDTADDESGVALFISHHLEEIDADYWKRHFSAESPEPQRILHSLVLQSHWGGDDEIGTFDFTLPEDVTNYLISVSFDEDGDVSGITMES